MAGGVLFTLILLSTWTVICSELVTPSIPVQRKEGEIKRQAGLYESTTFPQYGVPSGSFSNYIERATLVIVFFPFFAYLVIVGLVQYR